MAVVSFIAGLVLLVLGAEALVRGASRLAAALGIPSLIIGLTIVAFGTSAPELAVGLKAAVSAQAEIAVGNVVGSNIFNILFILGLAALVAPLTVSQRLIRLEVPLLVAVSAAALLLGRDGRLGRTDGLLLAAGLAVYIGFLMVQGRKAKPEPAEAVAGPRGGWIKNAVLILAGLGLLVLGSRWLVEAAVVLARRLGVGELTVGLTIVAAGTSLPELVTSVVASVRGERDIAVGNVIGSNLFNLMGVLGLSALAAPAGIAVSPAARGFDLPIMVVVAVVCLPVFFTGGIISRREGLAMLAYY
uniref:calcium/sodium antiporter n=1 Tax=Pontiella sp. TaxID=2837462 RepID=UPI00356B2AD8